MIETGNIKIKPEDIFEIIFRRRWLLIFPVFVTLMLGLFVVFTATRKYEAHTVIMVQPQSVPKDYVRSVVTIDMEDRIAAIEKQILSRTNLEKIIIAYNLFSSKAYDNMFIEDKLNIIRDNISISVSRREGTFTVGYKGKNPHKVKEIANKLAHNFIDANLKVREDQAVGTSKFLESELENARDRLVLIENKIKSFRQKNMGELPEQLPSNLEILKRLQAQFDTNEQSLRDINARLDMVDNQIYERSKLIGKKADEVGTYSSPSEELMVMKNKLVELKNRYTADHPDVIALKSKIDSVKKKYEVSSEQKNNKQFDKPGQKTVFPKYSDPKLVQRTELLREREKLKAKNAQLSKQIDLYRLRIENTPKREQELIAMNRDYENINDLYRSLMNRKLEAELSLSMERKQKGEQFHIIDPARVPNKPSSPNLKKIFMVSVVLGLGIGCGLTLLLEFFDEKYRKLDDLENNLDIPVVGVIPPVYTKRDIFKKKLDLSLCGMLATLTFILFLTFAIIAKNGTEYVIDFLRRYMYI